MPGDAPTRRSQSSSDLTTGSVAAHLLRMTGAGSLALVAIWSYLFLEVLMATRLAGAAAASGIAIGGLCFGLLLTFAFAWASVMTAAVGRLVGMQRRSDAQALATLATVVGGVVSAAICLLLFAARGPVAQFFLGDDAAARHFFAEYFDFVCLATPPSAVAIAANGAQRAFGDARNPMLTNLGATAAGLLGLAVVVPALGPAGSTFGLVLLLNRTTMMMIALRRISVFRDPARRLLDAAAWRECRGVLRTVPAQLLVNLAPSLSGAVLLSLGAQGGAPLVAALTLVNRTDSLLGSPLFAYQGSVTPIAAQNAGARRLERVRQLRGLVCVLAALYALVIWGLVRVALAFEPQLLTSAAGADPRLLHHYVNWALPFLCLAGIVVAFSCILIALRRPSWASGLAVFRAVLTIVLAYALWPFIGPAALLLGPIVATAITAAVGDQLLRWTLPQAAR